MSSTNEDIVNVWDENLEEELDNITELIEKYNYIAVDTEFPGTVHQSENINDYNHVRNNVNDLKLIQVGFSLANEKGETPQQTSTWQFNLSFDLGTDPHAVDSIDMLKGAGIDFEQLKQNGIPILRFAELLLSSGLVLTDQVHWICFHGSFDFGYLLRAVTNSKMPAAPAKFASSLKTYFPNIYDIKAMLNEVTDLKSRSLNKLAYDLEVKRTGMMHQAGSDSLVTLECFFKLRDNYFKKGIPRKLLNQIFGLDTIPPAIIHPLQHAALEMHRQPFEAVQHQVIMNDMYATAYHPASQHLYSHSMYQQQMYYQ